MVSDLVASGRAWEPILDGKLADDARGAVGDVARAIADGQGDPTKLTDLTLFWAYVAGALDDDWVAAKYDEATAALCNEITHGIRHLSLYYGAAGVGFVLAHVSEPGAADEVLAVIDEVIDKGLDVPKWTGEYDLIGGLVGIGVYLVERVSSGDAPIARRALDRVVGHLIDNSETTPQGVAWFTPPDHLPDHQRERWPRGYFNCGVAHGIPGIVALLGRVAALPDADPRYATLCKDTLRWLWAQQIPGGKGRFPASFGRDEKPTTPTRTAWCYGDPGAALAMWSATARLGMPTGDVIAFARESTAVPFENSGIVDAALCHGAAGLGHIYNRCYQASGDPAFRDGARRWLHKALELRRPDHSVGGFSAWTTKRVGEPLVWAPVTNLLEGATGIALALLAALEPVEPSWDRLLQCDMP